MYKFDGHHYSGSSFDMYMIFDYVTSSILKKNNK